MRKRQLLLGIHLLAYITFTRGQLLIVPGTKEPKRPQHVHRHDRRVSLGIKGGFISSLFLASDLVLNGTVTNEVQDNCKIGYFDSLLVRINFKCYFLQLEFSYTINRCNITSEKPPPDDVPESSAPEMASITSSIHSFEIPVIYRYNIIKEKPYNLVAFGGPKIRYIWDEKSKVTFENLDQRDIKEELYPLDVSLTTGIAITISRIFFDF